MRTAGVYLLLYDGDCRICTAVARGVERLDVHGNIHAQPIQDSAQLLAAVPPEEMLGAAHAIAPDGRVTSGAEVVPTLAGALLAAPGVEARLRSSRASMRLISRLYGFLVEFRGRLTCGALVPASAARSPR